MEGEREERDEGERRREGGREERDKGDKGERRGRRRGRERVTDKIRAHTKCVKFLINAHPITCTCIHNIM